MIARRTKRDVIRRALHCAIRDRESYVDSWGPHCEEPSVLQARADVEAFKAMLAKDYGELTVDDDLADRQRRGLIHDVDIHDIPTDQGQKFEPRPAIMAPRPLPER